MNPTDPNTNMPTDPAAMKKFNPLAVMQPGETVICEIRRHPIGIIGMYAFTGILLLALAVIVFGVAPNFITTYSRSQVLSAGSLVFLVAVVLSVSFLLLAHVVYWGNRWVLSSDSLTQITQSGLFRKQSSQLSLANLEDVTAEQNGVLTHMFNYGLLKVETAGERSKFMFPYCPNPTGFAQEVLKAREVFEQSRHASPGAPADPGINYTQQS